MYIARPRLKLDKSPSEWIDSSRHQLGMCRPNDSRKHNAMGQEVRWYVQNDFHHDVHKFQVLSTHGKGKVPPEETGCGCPSRSQILDILH